MSRSRRSERFLFCRAVALALAAGLWLGAAAPASAAPADRRIEIEPGETRIERLGPVARLHVEDPERLHAEMLPSGEVLLEGRTVGVTHVFFHGQSWVYVWRVFVGAHPDPEAREAALRAVAAKCPGTRQDASVLRVRIGDAACQEAVVRASRHLLAKELEVTFDTDGIRAQLSAQEEAIRKMRPDLTDLRFVYLGGSFGIRGRVATWEEVDAMVRTAWRAAAGKLLLDVSGLTVEAPAEKSVPKAGETAAAQEGRTTSPPAREEEEAPSIEIIRGFPPGTVPGPKAPSGGGAPRGGS